MITIYEYWFSLDISSRIAVEGWEGGRQRVEVGGRRLRGRWWEFRYPYFYSLYLPIFELKQNWWSRSDRTGTRPRRADYCPSNRYIFPNIFIIHKFIEIFSDKNEPQKMISTNSVSTARVQQKKTTKNTSIQQPSTKACMLLFVYLFIQKKNEACFYSRFFFSFKWFGLQYRSQHISMILRCTKCG